MNGNAPEAQLPTPKLKVYCETSFWSYLTARPSSNAENAIRQSFSLRWWENIAPQCSIFVSDVVFDEAKCGNDDAMRRRLAEISRQTFIAFDRVAVGCLARRLRDEHQVFANEVTDAIHIAISAISGMDVLLTWNCKHMANIVELPKTVSIVTKSGYDCPLILTPQDFLEKFHE